MNEQDPLIGQQIDNYKIERLLGQGGMAVVYLAQDLVLKRPVVLKMMLPDLARQEEIRLRFEREAQATAQLQHPNIIPIYTIGTAPNGRPYLALQYIEGGSLSDYLEEMTRQGRWISTIYALSLVHQMAAALATAHKANIIHRDLKPSNILLRQDGTPVISDLGIAAVQQATLRLTHTGGIIGTPNYMSPEQASSHFIDGRSDLYSLGIILYELLSGRLPFHATSPVAMLHNHIYEQPTPLQHIRPDLTAATYAVVATCLQKKPIDRYPNAQALVAALEQAIAAENANPKMSLAAWQPTVIESETGLKKTTGPPKAKRPLWLYALVLIGLLFTGSLALLAWRQNSPLVIANDPSASGTTASGTTASATATATLATTPTNTVTLVVATETAVPSLIESQPIGTVPTPAPTLEPTASPLYLNGGRWPNGLIAYSCGAAGEEQLFLTDPNNAQSFSLPNQPPNSLVPAFAPNSTELAFRSNSSGSWQIYAANLDGSNMRQLTTSPGNNYEGVWSPDSQRLAFASDRTGIKQIFTMNRDGTDQQQITSDNVFHDDPSWSVNNQIVFESDPNGRFSIYQIPAQGGTAIALISAGAASATPAWSPDGAHLAFEVREGNERHIWIAAQDGTNLQRVTFDGSENQRPAWSPNGRFLAFHSNYQQLSPSQFDIWIVEISTGTLQQLTTRGNCYNPSWGQPPESTTFFPNTSSAKSASQGSQLDIVSGGWTMTQASS